jgi:hypothetical protein
MSFGTSRYLAARRIAAIAVAVIGLSSVLPPLPAQAATRSFVDVPGDAYYAEAVEWLKATGITTGAGASDVFAPTQSVTRGQMAAFLWRFSGKPSASTACGFVDVDPKAYFGKAVCWLKATGITEGMGAPNTFRPDVGVSRAQMAAFLWRFADRPSATNYTFIDERVIPEYARRAADWLKADGVTVNDPYGPLGNVTRAQMAAFLWRSNRVLDLQPFAPPTPTDVTAVPAGVRVVISWTAPVTSPRSAATNHSITVTRPDGGSIAEALPAAEGTAGSSYSLTTGDGETLHAVSGIEPGVELVFTVQALNDGGESGESLASLPVAVAVPTTNAPAENVVIASSPPEFTTFDPDGRASFPRSAGPDYQVGQVIVSDVGGRAYYGLVTHADDSVVQTDAVGLLDVVPELDLDLGLDITTAEPSTATDGIEFGGVYSNYEEVSSQGFGFGDTLSLSDVPLGGNASDAECGGVARSLMFKYRMEFLRFDASFQGSWDTGVQSAEMVWKPVMRATLSGGPGVGVECTLNIPIARKPLLSTMFVVFGVPVYFSLDFESEFFATVSTQVEATIDVGGFIKGAIGMRYSAGAVEPIADFKHAPVIDPRLMATGEATIGVRVALVASLYRVLTLEGYTALSFGIWGDYDIETGTGGGEWGVEVSTGGNLKIGATVAMVGLDFDFVVVPLFEGIIFEAKSPIGDDDFIPPPDDPGETRSTFLNTGDRFNIAYSVMDNNERFAYYGANGTFGRTGNVPSGIIKVELDPFRKVGELVLPDPYRMMSALMMDPGGEYLYVLTRAVETQQYLVKIRLSDLSIVSDFAILPSASPYTAATIDPTGDFVYVVGGGHSPFGAVDPGSAIKIDTATMEQVASGDLTCYFPFGQDVVSAHYNNGSLLLVLKTMPAQVVSINAATMETNWQYSFPEGNAYRYPTASALRGDVLYIAMRTSSFGAQPLLVRFHPGGMESGKFDGKDNSVRLSGNNVPSRGLVVTENAVYAVSSPTSVDVISLNRPMVRAWGVEIAEWNWSVTPAIAALQRSSRLPGSMFVGVDDSSAPGYIVRIDASDIIEVS